LDRDEEIRGQRKAHAVNASSAGYRFCFESPVMPVIISLVLSGFGDERNSVAAGGLLARADD